MGALASKIMPQTVISVTNLSKRYLIGHRFSSGGNYKYVALRDVLGREISNFARKAADFARGRQVVQGDEVEEFWALKDVSFEVKQGEVLGIIGRNGAGKSTLLKILSRITEPTEGRVLLRGRVASLLEVGTGFHPELTGRENIFLNGAILGMRQQEIRKKFDEIVTFAEVEKFLDTPVKHYSSGMYVRLAFAVAAHLEPEILIVDEVLAVGDTQFQKKCLGKIRSVSQSDGRTVIFVSHQMSAISQLCSSAIRLSSGSLVSRGSCSDVIAEHLATAETAREVSFGRRPDRPTITRISINAEVLAMGHLGIELDFESPFPVTPVPGIVISSLDGTPVFGSNPRFHKDGYVSKRRSSGTIKMRADGLPLASGEYVLSVWLGDWQSDYDHKQDVLKFEFRTESSLANRPPSSFIGHLEWPAKWTV